MYIQHIIGRIVMGNNFHFWHLCRGFHSNDVIYSFISYALKSHPLLLNRRQMTTSQIFCSSKFRARKVVSPTTRLILDVPSARLVALFIFLSLFPSPSLIVRVTLLEIAIRDSRTNTTPGSFIRSIDLSLP